MPRINTSNQGSDISRIDVLTVGLAGIILLMLGSVSPLRTSNNTNDLVISFELLYFHSITLPTTTLCRYIKYNGLLVETLGHKNSSFAALLNDNLGCKSSKNSSLQTVSAILTPKDIISAGRQQKLVYDSDEFDRQIAQESIRVVLRQPEAFDTLQLEIPAYRVLLDARACAHLGGTSQTTITIGEQTYFPCAFTLVLPICAKVQVGALTQEPAVKQTITYQCDPHNPENGFAKDNPQYLNNNYLTTDNNPPILQNAPIDSKLLLEVRLDGEGQPQRPRILVK